ncbi:MAG: ExbD/TolR family protein, partial [Planctomycetota bacterium]
MMKKRVSDETLPINITPIIDIVFCLVLFFIASYAPKTRIGKLSTFLPKNIGDDASLPVPVDIMQEKEEISVYISYFENVNRYFYGTTPGEKKDLNAILREIANIVKNKEEGKVPPVRLRPGKNVGLEA